MSEVHSGSPDRRTIGWLARSAGVSVQTIRFYEREELLPSAERAPSSNYRLFEKSAVDRLLFIGRAQELGFTLNEIRDLIRFEGAEDDPCDEVRAHAEEKLEDVRGKIRDLRRIKGALADLVTSCRQRGRADPCPIIRTLAGTERAEAGEPR